MIVNNVKNWPKRVETTTATTHGHSSIVYRCHCIPRNLQNRLRTLSTPWVKSPIRSDKEPNYRKNNETTLENLSTREALLEICLSKEHVEKFNRDWNQCKTYVNAKPWVEKSWNVNIIHTIYFIVCYLVCIFFRDSAKFLSVTLCIIIKKKKDIDNGDCCYAGQKSYNH